MAFLFGARGAPSRRAPARLAAYLTAPGWLISLLLLATAALAAVVAGIEGLTATLSESVESVERSARIEQDLLAVDKELALASAGPPALPRAELAARLRAGLRDARRQRARSSSASQALLARVESETEAVLSEIERQRRVAPPPEQITAAVRPKLENALAACSALVSFHIGRARLLHLRASRWDQTKIALGVAVVSLALLSLVALWRQVYRPTGELCAAVSRFGVAGKCPGAREVRPTDLRGVARVFDEVACALAKQEQSQLAFLGGVAHDLRNPLMVVKLAIAKLALDRSIADREPVRKAFAVMERQVERMERMVGDFLDTTRIQTGQIELRIESRDLRDMVQEVAETYRAASPAHEIHVSVPEQPVVLPFDPTRVEQILHNLVSNAIKYSPQGGPVRIALDRREGDAIIEIADRGIGILPDEMERLFEPFHRRPSEPGAPPGIGLGLSVARRLVEAHAGRIEVESTPGQGSTFRVLLPMGTSAPPA